MNKASARKAINEYLTIVVGCLIVSVGFVFFINPYKFVPGGVFGTSIVLHGTNPQLKVGVDRILNKYRNVDTLERVGKCLHGEWIGGGA